MFCDGKLPQQLRKSYRLGGTSIERYVGSGPGEGLSPRLVVSKWFDDSALCLALRGVSIQFSVNQHIIDDGIGTNALAASLADFSSNTTSRNT